MLIVSGMSSPVSLVSAQSYLCQNCPPWPPSIIHLFPFYWHLLLAQGSSLWHLHMCLQYTLIRFPLAIIQYTCFLLPVAPNSCELPKGTGKGLCFVCCHLLHPKNARHRVDVQEIHVGWMSKCATKQWEMHKQMRGNFPLQQDVVFVEPKTWCVF
jgi:hypothetical protein